MWTIFQVFIEFVITLLLFYVLFFLLLLFLTERHMGSHLPDQGTNPWTTRKSLQFSSEASKRLVGVGEGVRSVPVLHLIGTSDARVSSSYGLLTWPGAEVAGCLWDLVDLNSHFSSATTEVAWPWLITPTPPVLLYSSVGKGLRLIVTLEGLL